VPPPARQRGTRRLCGRRDAEPTCGISAPAPGLVLSAVVAQVSVGTCQSKHRAWPKHRCWCRCQEGSRGEEEEEEIAPTGDYPWCGYTSIVGQTPFSLGERNVYFEKFNMIFSGPYCFQNNVLAVMDGQVRKHITEALFQIHELQRLAVGRRVRGDCGSGNRTVSSVSQSHLEHLRPPKPPIISRGLAFYTCW